VDASWLDNSGDFFDPDEYIKDIKDDLITQWPDYNDSNYSLDINYTDYLSDTYDTEPDNTLGSDENNMIM
ncbi:MAG: hypothetical protein U9Q30_04115, partial [Campylobacterota bacterium]|nr:hypothetical protein [Campylobacterota bacterium]